MHFSAHWLLHTSHKHQEAQKNKSDKSKQKQSIRCSWVWTKRNVFSCYAEIHSSCPLKAPLQCIPWAFKSKNKWFFDLIVNDLTNQLTTLWYKGDGIFFFFSYHVTVDLLQWPQSLWHLKGDDQASHRLYIPRRKKALCSCSVYKYFLRSIKWDIPRKK